MRTPVHCPAIAVYIRPAISMYMTGIPLASTVNARLLLWLALLYGSCSQAALPCALLVKAFVPLYLHGHFHDSFNGLTGGNAVQNAGDSWSFDMVALDKASNGHSLSCFGFWLLQVGSRPDGRFPASCAGRDGEFMLHYARARLSGVAYPWCNSTSD